MRVAITTEGSRGDHQPYVALASGLRRAGYSVRMAGSPVDAFEQMAHSEGIPFVRLGQPPTPDAVLETITRLAGATSPAEQNRVLVEGFVLPRLEQAYTVCSDLVGWCDVVICHAAEAAGRIAADIVRKPFIVNWVVPPQYPTRWQPPPCLPNLGPLLNPVLWKAVFGLGRAHRPIQDGINGVRRRLGAPLLADLFREGYMPFGFGANGVKSKHDWRMAFQLQPAMGSPQLDLISVSPAVVPRSPGTPGHHHLTGYWVLEPRQWVPSEELIAFLDQGPPSVAVFFGTGNENLPELPAMREHLDAARRGLSEMVVQAVGQAGVRAIVYDHWFDSKVDHPDTMLCVSNVPHEWLFPRLAGVVHHGGAGTVAAALRAGIPAVAVPEVWDQWFWARTLERLRVGPASVPKSELGVERLSSALRALVQQQEYRVRALHMADLMKDEDGVANAVAVVESFVQSVRDRAADRR